MGMSGAPSGARNSGIDGPKIKVLEWSFIEQYATYQSMTEVLPEQQLGALWVVYQYVLVHI
jgi:hypothetical protein